ncbi:FkbM family methyltransferase [Aegicerativicinus sediminis]|uniref:FkbM family methyltransferase n=1 Tax=Aegicerativicinus sediminis TaxID=2893202 RepID=UPI001E37F642|nr:FkbM family methyltransferase [Aegicerativicinus sediminis]
MIEYIRRQINKIFYIDVIRFPSTDLRRRKKLLDKYNINLVLDVGSNVGQYARQLRQIGYKGTIHSFEPQSKVFKILAKNSKSDSRWQCHNFGFGDKKQEMQINISENSYSSSILELTDSHLSTESKSKFVALEGIEVKKLDDFLPEISGKNNNVFLKLDVQGYEDRVLKGSSKSLDKIIGIQIEMSLVPMYSGEVLFIEMTEKLQSLGFKLQSLENGFYDRDSGQLLQVDGIFFKE